MSTATPLTSLHRLALVGLLALACNGASEPTETAPSLPDVTAPPTAVASPATPTPAETATSTPWPDGWQTAFCAAFEETVVAQELARDIGRAFDEDARDDAAGLAHELEATIENVRELLEDLPEWAEAAGFEEQMIELLEQDERLARFWLRHLEQGRRPALRNARNVEATLREEAVPAVQAELRALARLGVRCPGQELQLEIP